MWYRLGGKVEFPNRDPFFHNVFSLFEGKRFDLGLYESGTTRFVQFDKPGISFIFCNIHAEMSAVVIAVATPYYAISNAKGEITLPEVPPGRYDVQVFHSSVSPDTLRAAQREVTLSSADSSLGTFSLAETDAPRPHTKISTGRDYDRPDPNRRLAYRATRLTRDSKRKGVPRSTPFLASDLHFIDNNLRC